MARNIEFDETDIIIKAQKVFWRKGYHATSMQDLVKATGLNPGSIYNSFGSKHGLFLLCLKNYVQPVQDFDPAKARDKNSLQMLKSYIKGIVAGGSLSEDACLSAKTSFEMAAADEEICGLLKCSANKAFYNMEQLIIHAQNDNLVRKDLDPSALAQLITATLSGLGQNFILFKEKKRIEKIIDNLIVMITS
ncbi:TetR/AcrR family transcriptional regulator [Chryseobacterium tongliaoense]|uniref:TetR/AcrR family transcriptional regulator n=1 Tax=Chryseobacterium tongliaoense TaxID=3240933 RepID=UPI003519656D